MNRAVCMVRDAPHYRRDAICAGLRAAGFQVTSSILRPVPGDCVVVWNRYGPYDAEAKKFEAAGAAVIVVENGYLGHHEDEYRKLFTPDGDQIYAMALWHHNGGGNWWVGAPGRWREQGIHVKPWRTDGKHVLVLPQRGIGPPGVAMPNGWENRALTRLKKMTQRPVRVRSHPGNSPTQKPLEDDLRGAWCVVLWASGGGLKAICAGVSVFYDFPKWIGAPASWPFSDDNLDVVEAPFMYDKAREEMLDRLAWAQWTVPEIATGEPFRKLMSLYDAQVRAA